MAVVKVLLAIVTRLLLFEHEMNKKAAFLFWKAALFYILILELISKGKREYIAVSVGIFHRKHSGGRINGMPF